MVKVRSAVRAGAGLGLVPWLALGGCEGVLGLNGLTERTDGGLSDATTSDQSVADSSAGDAALDVAPPDSAGDTGGGATDGGSDSSDAPTLVCADGSAGDGGRPTSCQAGATGAGLDCSGSLARDCCESLAVPGGTFDRSYDGVDGGGYVNPKFTATVSGLRLDSFEVTVGRFRQFVHATECGWLPATGSGKHTHLPDGGVNGGAELGWVAAWTSNLATTEADWDTRLTTGCNATKSAWTWTSQPAGKEHLPINCLDWYDAYAFCIWDGGFLPTEAEWNFASAGGGSGGGDGQRAYPWSVPPTSEFIDDTHAAYACTGALCGSLQAVGQYPKGNSRWVQWDLGGNVKEWTLDFFTPSYSQIPCNDCANLAPAGFRSLRGGAFDSPPTVLLSSARDDDGPLSRQPSSGVRCARAP